jgi:urea-proton symporter
MRHLIGGAVFPAAFTVTWAGQSAAEAIAGAIAGLIAGLIAWLVTAYQYFGELTVASTGEEYSTLAGNLAAVMTGLIVTVVVSWFKPQNFDLSITRAINSEPMEAVLAGEVQPENDKGEVTTGPATVIHEEAKEKLESGSNTPPKEDLPTVKAEDAEMAADAQVEEHSMKLKRAFLIACVASFVLTFILDFLVRSQEHTMQAVVTDMASRFQSRCSCRTMSSAKVSSRLGL